MGDGALGCALPRPTVADPGQPCGADCELCVNTWDSNQNPARVCTVHCDSDEDCPFGFDCRTVDAEDEAQPRACIPGNQECGTVWGEERCQSELRVEAGGVDFCSCECIPGTEGNCPDGFVWTAHSYGTECLKLAAPSGKVPDPAKAASRLETRRYAAMLGATTELEKAEGVTWDPETGRVYLAVSVVGGRMLAEDGAPVDHVKMGPNPCGLVLAGETAAGASDTSGAAIDSPHVMTRFVPELVGRPLAQPDEQGNSCDVDGIANPDNLTFLPGWGLLMVAEDTKRHRNAVLWAHDVRSRRLARVVISPRGGELTGIHWIPDLGGHGYLTVAVQHPWGELPKGQEIPEFVTEDDKRSFTGWLGPFPSLR